MLAVRHDVARQQCVDRDPFRGGLQGEGARETRQPRPQGGADGEQGVGLLGHQAGDVDDAAPLPLPHGRQHQARHAHHVQQGGVHAGIPVRVAEVVEGRSLGTAGVGDENVHRTQGRHGGPVPARQVIGAGDISRHRQGPDAQGLQLLSGRLQGLGAPAAEGDRAALGPQGQGRSSAQALAASRHHRHLAPNAQIHVVLQAPRIGSPGPGRTPGILSHLTSWRPAAPPAPGLPHPPG